MPETIPRLYTELPYLEDSSAYFELISELDWPIYLDSAHPASQQGRYDILAADPIIKLITEGHITTISSKQNEDVLSEHDPFSLLQNELAKFPKQTKSHLPFCGGALGYFGYDLGRRIEDLPSIAHNNEHIPDMAVGIYDWAITLDHQTKRCWLASYANDQQTIDNWQALINTLSTAKPTQVNTFKVSGELSCNLPQQQYTHAFNKIQHYIREGDCYQVNLAKRFEIKASGNPWHAYRKLRQHNPAPFSAYFSLPELTLLSSSPERLLWVNDTHVETKPIKGTRRRDLGNPNHDKQIAEELIASTKDRAENLMIVDLLRNDLGKVCETGSIKVPKPFALESFATVHHLVSTITGTLAKQHTPISLLRACFPGGSITGAPKLRAMEIIEELEPDRRGAYCGSIAYIGFDGQMDSNILIRTLVYSNNRLRFWAGGGIVAYSTAGSEYQEAHDKAAAMVSLIEQLR
jgi:para-aminobenzoate synthetase component 1